MKKRKSRVILCLSKILVTIPFAVTAKTLLYIGKKCHLTYNMVNIIVWYALLPLLWAGILDYKLHQLLFVPSWFLLCVGIGIMQYKKFNKFCDELFRLSQMFILLFGNYYLWSVVICLLVPVLITIVLLIA